MHRHGYQGKKFGRQRDQRQALLKGLAEALITHGSIETTLPKAKETLGYTEKLITKAKKGDLHSRRQVIASLATLNTAHKLFDEIAPKLASRSSGYLRVRRTSLRRGDGAQLAKVSFVDDLTKTIATEAVKQTTKSTKTVTKTNAKESVAKKSASKEPKK